jgi:hypothetical protein
VENPVSILDQEESKKFLCGKPEDKYKFFMKATDLERMDNSYAATIDQLRELEAAKARAEESMEPLRQTEDQLRDRWRAHDEVQRLEKKVERVRCDLLWALHGEADQEYRDSLAVRTALCVFATTSMGAVCCFSNVSYPLPVPVDAGSHSASKTARTRSPRRSRTSRSSRRR